MEKWEEGIDAVGMRRELIIEIRRMDGRARGDRRLNTHGSTRRSTANEYQSTSSHGQCNNGAQSLPQFQLGPQSLRLSRAAWCNVRKHRRALLDNHTSHSQVPIDPASRRGEEEILYVRMYVVADGLCTTYVVHTIIDQQDAALLGFQIQNSHVPRLGGRVSSPPVRLATEGQELLVTPESPRPRGN